MRTGTVLTLIMIVLLSACTRRLPPSAALTEPATTGAPARAVDSPSPAAVETTPPPETGPAATETAPPEPGAEAPPAGWIAYIAVDGNLWMVDRVSGERLQLTQDGAPAAAPPGDTGVTVNYRSPQWSFDGRYLAYQKELFTPQPQGLNYSSELWVYDMDSSDARLLIEDQIINGFDWQPGAHKLVYGMPVEPDYFTGRGQVNTAAAHGLWSLDVDSGENSELVPPEGGFSLINPVWWGEGRFLTFEEIYLMEGRGRFAYYDFETGQYMSWEEPVGGHSLDESGARLAYDTLVYIPTGTERIWMRDLEGGEPQPVSPEYEPGYAYNPVFSPQGDRLAYLASLEGPESQEIALFVIDPDGGEPQHLGLFEQPQNLSWSPDGSRLIFSAGPYDQPQLMEAAVESGEVRNLGGGSQPAWQPVQP